MSGSGHDWITYLIGPAVFVYILDKVCSIARDAYNDWWHLEHVAISIRREILLNVGNLETFIPAFAGMTDTINEDPNYRPFMSINEHSGEIMRSMQTDMLRLPGETVDSLIEFYGYDNEVNEILKRMQTDEFSRLSITRKLKMVETLQAVLEDMKTTGRGALEGLEAFLAIRKQGLMIYVTRKIRLAFSGSNAASQNTH